jgi:PilZ domain
MGEAEKSRRIRERLELKLPVRIHSRETPDFEWTEVTRLIDVTPFGAGFTLKRPTERGRLLHMTIPMPRQLRVFDHVEDQYRVWAIVRYIRPVVSPQDKTPHFEVGVAFIGKRPPASYEEDPAKRYEITAPVPQTGALTISEQAEDNVQSIDSTDKRARTRHDIPVDILLETFNDKGEVEQTESTVTENISRKGAALYTAQEIPLGRFVRLTSSQYELTVHAAVRGHSKGGGGIPRIHVEFIDCEWPLD